jgi:hypothetical protein
MAALVVLMSVFIMADSADAVLTAKTINWDTKVNNMQFGYATFTWAASRDSARFVGSNGIGFKWENRGSTDDVVGTIVIGTSTLNGDSISIYARYQTSIDGVNWASYTLGTDSTTFTTTLSGSDYRMNNFPISKSTHGGYQPYSRLLLYTGSTYNIAGTKAKVGFINQ